VAIHLTGDSHTRAALTITFYFRVSLCRALARQTVSALVSVACMPRAGHDPGKFEPHSDG